MTAWDFEPANGLPDHLNWIVFKKWIVGYQGKILLKALSDEDTVERVTVMQCNFFEACNVV